MIKNIAIIGAGQMGSGIAVVCSLSKYHVQIIDISDNQLKKAQDRIIRDLDRQVLKGKISPQEKEHALQNIQYKNTLQNPETIDIAIEAVSENMEIKVTVLENLDKALPSSAIIASNTSSLSITQLANSTKRPTQVIGMHFMNPASIMPLVEVVKGSQTSVETVTIIQDMILNLGKRPVFSKDVPGFIVNRILMPMINEAIYALSQDVASAQDIDTAMKLGTHQPMGPLELADFIGLDTCLAIMHVLHQGLGEEKYRPCPLLVQYVTSGKLGKKSGQGFYSYNEK